MGIFKKLSSAIGSLGQQKAEESSALDSIRKMKEELGMEQRREEKYDDKEWEEDEDLDEEEVEEEGLKNPFSIKK